MNLFLVRHAIAVPASPDFPDAARPLTPDGRKKLEKVVRGLERLDVRFDRLYHSPWTRAVETANLLTELLDGESVVEQGLARAPDAELIGRLQGERAAAIGHEPWMSELLSLLVAGNKVIATSLDFKKGGIAWLEGEPRPKGMRLLAFIPPRVLRRL
jgi:phosphohistidine phosphatase